MSRRLTFGTGLFWLLTATARAASDAEVIFPGRDATAPAPAAGNLGSMTLVLGAIMAAVGLWLFWRGRRHATAAATGRALAIEETRSLGNRQYLVVASYQGQKFLLGVCPGRIDHLAALPADKSQA